MNDTNLTTFKVISNFTKELNNVFGDTYRSLKLYAHLINKTTIVNDKPIQKHINAFREFCVKNHEAIINKNKSLLKKDTIKYSKRVFINIKKIFLECDKDTESIIWKHLLTISAMVDPGSKAKDILKELSENTGQNNEINFLENIINKVEDNVDCNSNPMEAISSIMKSGIFTDLVNGMGDGLQNGNLDLSKLLGTVQTMVGKLSEENGGDNDETMNMMNSMLNGLQQNSGGENTQNEEPNIANMLGPMLNMIGGAGGGISQQGIPNISSMINSNSLPNVNDMLTIEETKEEEE